MKPMNSKQLKKIAEAAGADLCGIASAGRFRDAPEGFKPMDIYPEARSVVVLAKRFPEGVFSSTSPVPYTFASDTVLHEVFRITCELCLRLEDSGIIAVPVPSEPYEYWDEAAREGKGILSLKHAGYLAGLGVMGKNTLLVNEEFGNRIVLGAILTDAELEEDPISGFSFCSEKCSLCIDHCPGNALGASGVIQKECRKGSIFCNTKGYTLETCHVCRSVCPGGRGKINRA